MSMSESKARYPWKEVQIKYETGRYSMKELAGEYGFSYVYALRKAKKNNWLKGKTKYKIAQLTKEKIFDYNSTTEAEIRQEFATIFGTIRERTMGILTANTGEKVKNEMLTNLKIGVSIIASCRDNEWEVYEIKEVAKQISKSINTKKDIDFSDLNSEDLKSLIKGDLDKLDVSDEDE